MWREVKGDASMVECTGYPFGSGCGVRYKESYHRVRLPGIGSLIIERLSDTLSCEWLFDMCADPA
jgi:hypothetical protein